MSANADKQVADREGPIASAAPLGEIPYEVAGKPTTMLSAARVNRIIKAYNAFENLTVGPGLILTKSESGYVISLRTD